MPRRDARVDANQKEIVQAFRAMGATVQHLHTVGGGCPDLVVGYRGLNLLVEVKDGSKPPSKRKLTEHEQAFFDEWNGQVTIVDSVHDVSGILVVMGLFAKAIDSLRESMSDV